MAQIEDGLTMAAGFRRPTALMLLGFVLLFPRAGHAQGALPFSGSYSITGNYVVGTVDLAPQHASNGLVTGTIPMSGVPANAEILAAFLYWETIWTDEAQLSGAKFRGQDITLVRASEQILDRLQERQDPIEAAHNAPRAT